MSSSPPAKRTSVLATRPCWGCGRTCPDGETFGACQLCKDEKLVACTFCTVECLNEHWPRHKKWHREQRKTVEIDPSQEINLPDRLGMDWEQPCALIMHSSDRAVEDNDVLKDYRIPELGDLPSIDIAPDPTVFKTAASSSSRMNLDNPAQPGPPPLPPLVTFAAWTSASTASSNTTMEGFDSIATRSFAGTSSSTSSSSSWSRSRSC